MAEFYNNIHSKKFQFCIRMSPYKNNYYTALYTKPQRFTATSSRYNIFTIALLVLLVAIVIIFAII